MANLKPINNEVNCITIQYPTWSIFQMILDCKINLYFT